MSNTILVAVIVVVSLLEWILWFKFRRVQRVDIVSYPILHVDEFFGDQEGEYEATKNPKHPHGIIIFVNGLLMSRELYKVSGKRVIIAPENFKLSKQDTVQLVYLTATQPEKP